jgi:glycosyltransferase involved in cell wall biosynthesis
MFNNNQKNKSQNVIDTCCKLLTKTKIPDKSKSYNLRFTQNNFEKCFCFVISSYNNSFNIENNLLSIINQTYENWRVIYINDNSTDNTEELFFNIVNKNKYISDKFTYIKNKERYKQMYNKYQAYKLVKDFEIVCLLDGDDWLSHDNALHVLNEQYKTTDNKIITSNYHIFENNKLKSPPADTFYSQLDIENNTIRYHETWYLKHLKTGYGILFKSIPENYLKYNDTWLDMCTDCAEMYSACEYSNGKIMQIKDILYVYNKQNSVLYSSSYYNNGNSKDRLDKLNYIKSLPICKYALPYTCVIHSPNNVKKKRHMLKQMTLIRHKNYEFIEINNMCDNVKSLYQIYLIDYISQKYYEKIENYNLKFCYSISNQNITPETLDILHCIFNLLEQFVKNDDLHHILILQDDVYSLKNIEYYLCINDILLENKDVVYLGCYNSKHNIYEDILNISNQDAFINVSSLNYLIHGGYSTIISKKFARFILSFGLDNIVNLNLSWELFLNFIRDLTYDVYNFNFYVYFKELFVVDLLKNETNNKSKNLDQHVYNEREVKIENYYT